MARYTSDYRSASKETYKKFSAAHPSIKITFEQFDQIIRTYNGMIMTHLLETGDMLELPQGFGKISINKKPTKTTYTDKEGNERIILPINWGATNKKRAVDPDAKPVYIFNDHSEGFRCRWMWFRDESKIRMREIWEFRPAKEWSLAIKDYLFRPDGKKFLHRYSEWQGRNKTN